MVLKNYINYTYPTVEPFEGINAVEKLLLENHYLVVMDANQNYHGILSTADVVKRPHKIVIDCITKKECLTAIDTLETALEKFYSSEAFVLAVMNGSDFIGVIEKNQILRALETKVNNLHDKALISEKAKKNFLSNLSHEIRTPLNGIIGFMDLIAQLNTSDILTQDESFYKTIKESSAHFLMLMNDLVDLSLLCAGEVLSVKKEKVDLVKIFSELKDFFSELTLFQNRRATLCYLNAESSFNIYSDEKKLKQILYHLILNSLKFSEDHKVVFGFELKPHAENVSLFVKNKDSNIAQKDLQKMFDVFEKQENIGKELNFGLGIGLPLVKNLIDLLGGKIKVETTNEEITFIVNIPLGHESVSLQLSSHPNSLS